MWIYVPGLPSGRSAQEPEQEISGSDWRFQALARSSTWREKHIAPQRWFAQWKKAVWLKHLCGRMQRPSTAARGVASFIASLRRTPASRSHARVSNWAGKIPATSGRTSAASSEKPSLPWCLSRMSGPTSATGSGKSATTFESWATKLGQDCLARRKWARRMRGSDFSLWPTTSATEGKRASNSRYIYGDQRAGMMLAKEAENWRTPDAPGQGGPRTRDISKGDGHQVVLAEQAENWGSPRETDSRGASYCYSRGNHEKKIQTLVGQMENRQSPQSRDHRSGEIDPETAKKHLGSRPLAKAAEDSQTHRSGRRSRELLLTGATQAFQTPAENWQTPATDSFRSRGGKRVKEMGLDQQARRSTSRPTVPATGKDGKPCWCLTPGCVLPSHRRRLNIFFDCWLMGWPLNWSSATGERIGFEAWEMESSRLLSQWLSHYFAARTDSISEMREFHILNLGADTRPDPRKSQLSINFAAECMGVCGV